MFQCSLRRITAAATALAAAVWLAPVEPAAAAALPRPDHITIVVFENKDVEDVLDPRRAPYFASTLVPQGALFTNAHAVAHPSLPNYLALFSGTTHGVRNDRCDNRVSGPTLASEAVAAGDTWVGYSENMPAAARSGACISPDRLWAKKHAPWFFFASSRGLDNRPYRGFPGSLPTLAWIVPNMCNDMHDCAIADGDAWMKRELPAIVRYDAAHNGLLVVTFDESDSYFDDNRIATLLVGPMVRARVKSGDRIDHYSVLRTIETMLHLPPLGHSAGAAPIAGVWK